MANPFFDHQATRGGGSYGFLCFSMASYGCNHQLQGFQLKDIFQGNRAPQARPEGDTAKGWDGGVDGWVGGGLIEGGLDNVRLHEKLQQVNP